MANELWVTYTSGLGTLKAELRREDRRYVWDGSAFALQSALTDAQWRAGLLDLTEQTTADLSETGFYVGSMPLGMETGEYILRAFNTPTPDPNTNPVSEQAVAWRADAEVTAEDIDLHIDTTCGGAGGGDITVNHDYGGADTYRYVDSDGVGIDGAVIQCYRTTDYDAGNRTVTYVVATSETNIDGRWVRDMMLEVGEYTLVFYKSGAFGPDTADLEVVAV